MRRPDFITNEDIARWDETITDDSDMPAVYTDQPIIREVIYVGFWIGEKLLELGCNPILATRIQYTVGQLAFGNDPWQIAQEVLQSYQNNELEFEIDYDA